ncbi:MAG: GGDEF domain-containing protein [Rhodospirillales bacterium]|nr:MAG: GGDEF domain-containing protein [Rhodospirillales bacterium]
MDYSHSLDEAGEYAQLSLALMDDQRITPHPNNFTVWYNYFSGAHPELKRTLDVLLNSSLALSEARNEQIYRKFCASPYDAVPLHIMAGKMEVELGAILAVLEKAGHGTAAYEKTLEATSGALDRAEHLDLDALRPLVSRLLAETRSMVEQSQQLERQLTESANRIGQLTEELESARRDAMTDALTGLANRKLFDSLLRQSVLDSIESREPLALLFVDVDHFKRFNDTYGHAVGDQVLRLLARMLQRNIRGQDSACRFGGEEFAVILPQTDLDNAVKVAEAIRKQVAGKSIVQRKSGDRLGQITVSIGVAVLALGEPLRQFVERADQALYLAKRLGRNRVVSEAELERRDVAVVP